MEVTYLLLAGLVVVLGVGRHVVAGRGGGCHDGRGVALVAAAARVVELLDLHAGRGQGVRGGEVRRR